MLNLSVWIQVEDLELRNDARSKAGNNIKVAIRDFSPLDGAAEHCVENKK